jgi:cyanate permease
MLSTAAIVLGCLAAVALAYRPPPGLLPDAQPGPAILSRREWILVGLAGLMWGGDNAGYIVLVSFLPDVFVDRGQSRVEAAQLVSLLGWVLIPAVPFAGVIAERINKPYLIMTAGLAVVALTSAALPFSGDIYPVFTVLVAAIAVPAGLIIALPAQALRPEARAYGMGIFYSVFYAAMAVLPSIAGILRDVSERPSAPVLFSAATMLMCCVLLAGFKVARGVAGNTTPRPLLPGYGK